MQTLQNHHLIEIETLIFTCDGEPGSFEPQFACVVVDGKFLSCVEIDSWRTNGCYAAATTKTHRKIAAQISGEDSNFSTLTQTQTQSSLILADFTSIRF